MRGQAVFIVIVAFMVVLALIVRCPATDARDGAIAALRDASALPKFALECRLDLVTGEAKMRVFSMTLIAFAALTQAHAQGPSESKVPGIVCGYSINGYRYEVANGRVFVGARRFLMVRCTRC